MLYNHHIFDQIFPRNTKPYLLKQSNSGKYNEIDYKGYNRKLKEVINHVYFRVFIFEFEKAYVGDVGARGSAAAQNLHDIGNYLNQIKMEYYNKKERRSATIDPDTVYMKMHQYIELITQESSEWPFCLLSIYFHALTKRLQTEMIDNSFMIARPHQLK